MTVRWNAVTLCSNNRGRLVILRIVHDLTQRRQYGGVMEGQRHALSALAGSRPQ